MLTPASIPLTCRPMQFDLEEPSWAPLLSDCDLIHVRMLLGSIQTDLWPQTYRNIFEFVIETLRSVRCANFS